MTTTKLQFKYQSSWPLLEMSSIHSDFEAHTGLGNACQNCADLD